MKKQPIGLLDSGVGGLTVVKEVMKLLPNEEILYIGDSARNPYGPRSKEEVLKFTIQLANFLVEKKIKLLIVACNTATVAALDYLQKSLEVSVIGVIEAGSKAAIEQTKNNNIGVIGTQGTINSNEYENTIRKSIETASVQSVACPRFVSIVEKDRYQDIIAQQIVAEELKPFENSNIDTLVLGCTHYPLLQNIIQSHLGDDLVLIDPGVETAKIVKEFLEEKDLLQTGQSNLLLHHFYTTGPVEHFSGIASNWLESTKFEVTHIPIEELETYEK